jgi:hypothetical protein
VATERGYRQWVGRCSIAGGQAELGGRPGGARCAADLGGTPGRVADLDVRAGGAGGLWCEARVCGRADPGVRPVRAGRRSRAI